jgi:type IV secretory pathway VirJ component
MIAKDAAFAPLRSRFESHVQDMTLRARLLLLTVLILAVPAGSQATAPNDRLAALKLVETPAARPGDTLAVLYSGDGGWGGLDRGVARTLAGGGVPVVGFNSLRYFSGAHSPQAAADDLAAAMRRYADLWGRSKVVLIGYSFGADALPAIVPLLPGELRARVKGLVLVGTGPTGDLRFHPTSWLGVAAPDGYPIAPAVEALKGLPMTCIYGDKERHDVCASLSAATIRQVRLPGSHHFNGDYATLGQAVLQAAAL